MRDRLKGDVACRDAEGVRRVLNFVSHIGNFELEGILQ